DIVDFNEMTKDQQKMTQEQLEVALVADFLKIDHPHLKLEHSDLFAEIENRSNLQFDELDAAQLLILGLKEPVKLNNEDNKEHNARIPFMEYLNRILHAARSDRIKLPDAVLAPHYDVDFNACTPEVISKMRSTLNDIVALTQYIQNSTVRAAIRNLQQQFEEQAQPGRKAKSHHIAPALPSAATRLTVDLPDFDEA
ncbi:MAG TPA: hypothetical protein VLF61_01695, partial [Rhabdochlamydiaceae bacterium]|nr:hypothetical protein [Rhabdochlamydiaceae bacterium]